MKNKLTWVSIIISVALVMFALVHWAITGTFLIALTLASGIFAMITNLLMREKGSKIGKWDIITIVMIVLLLALFAVDIFFSDLAIISIGGG